MMSMLAAKQVSTRDAMRWFAWESPDMIKVYERELEKARGDADQRALKLVESMSELLMEPPEIPKVLAKDADTLRSLSVKYSNISMGRIYGVSEAAVRKWLDQHGITRPHRVFSDLSEKEALSIREGLLR